MISNDGPRNIVDSVDYGVRIVDRQRVAKHRSSTISSPVASDKYHRNAPAANVELMLKFDPSHPRHLHIKQQATAPSRVVTFQKGQSRRKGFDRLSGRAQREGEPFTRGRVIVGGEYCLIIIRQLGSADVHLSAGQIRRSPQSRDLETFAAFRHATRRSSG
jgi:hypothetical protein